MKKILVIEDEKPVLSNIVEILTSGGFFPLCAENGITGIELAKENLPDLIVCDIMMPHLDGYEVLTELRSNPPTAAIPFIFLTAKADKTDLRQGMNLGADDYLTKPFRRQELLEAVSSRLAKHETLIHQYTTERQRAQLAEQKMQELQHLSDTHAELLKKLIADLCDPLSKINMAIRLMKDPPAGARVERYLEILQEEFDREIALLNQVSELQSLLTPDNVKLLRQFNLLNSKTKS
ncbi:response regulator [Ancylothrix sp. C2]|uniref:response regulator transcription factor n=1 Tax=Ancylothrix sp. D3o TaxID=2953691 RepID=UPI0021BB3A05|nr:response regulator [Ancylothrix sp. D3o]MCT7949567.1 response regulator [Ancylothrix sp. D3o]